MRRCAIVPAAVIVSVGVNSDGRRQALGTVAGSSEAETSADVTPLPQAGPRH
jgi:transposase-like protein